MVNNVHTYCTHLGHFESKNFTYLYGFLELKTEILKDPKTFIKLKAVFVFTEEVNKCIALFTEVQPASFQVLQ